MAQQDRERKEAPGPEADRGKIPPVAGRWMPRIDTRHEGNWEMASV
jgi:hypothetical protein